MHRDAPLRVYQARSDALKWAHFRMRYQVYCVDNAFEPQEAYPGGLETDEHDTYAEHFLVRAGSYHGRGRWVGTMRLIPPSPGTPEGGPTSLEVSRLIACDPRHRGTSRVLYYLCQAAQVYAVDHGYASLSFLVRPALARILGRQGLPLEQAGDPCNHRGLRIPYRVDAASAATALRDWRKRLGIPAAIQEAHYTPMYWPPAEPDPTLSVMTAQAFQQLQNG